MTRDKGLAWIAVGIAILLLAFASNAVSRLRTTQAALEESQGAAATSQSLRAELQLALTAAQVALAQEQTANAAAPSCVRAEVYAQIFWDGETITFSIGETALCATKVGKLVWVNEIYGPSFNEEDSLAEAWNEASRWRDCAESMQFCPEGFVRAK